MSFFSRKECTSNFNEFEVDENKEQKERMINNFSKAGKVARKRTELIKSFPDGEKRYQESPLLHAIIYHLVDGGDPLDIIDQLIINAEDTQKKFLAHMEYNKKIMVITQQDVDDYINTIKDVK